jgi:glucosylceramidase
MKTNGSMLHGGQLKPEFAETWADYYGRFIHAYEKEGIKIWGLTVQNEPMAVQTWESCVFTGDEERAFVRDHLGPALARAGLAGVKLMIWDHNRGIMYQRVKAVYDDPAAAKYVWGAAFHWYVGDHFDNVRLVHEAWPDKNLLMTEACLGPFAADRVQGWSLGEAYGNSLIHDLNNWAVGWTDWNVLLDEHGGPNHVGNYCFAPVHADTRSGALTFLNSYYYIGHFSKFIRPGARRIATTLNDDRLLASAFLNADGRVAVVVLNLKDEAIDFKLWIDGRAATTNSPAHSIITFVY